MISPAVSRPAPTTRAGTVARRRVARWEHLVALLLTAAVFAAIESVTPNIIGEDGYYHIKVAALIREHGPRLEFPWLRFTILNPAAYTDHHLLFHLLQAPFTVLDLASAAKLSAAVFATLGLWGCYLLMAANGVRWPLAWLVALLAVAHTFLWRHAMARPQSLALLLMAGVLWLTFTDRPRWLLPLGFVSAWLFDGFILPLTIPAAALAAALVLERRLVWQPLAALALGTVLGLVIHPYAPRNIVFAALHLLPKSGLGLTEEVPVGVEWYPYGPDIFTRRLGVTFLVMVLGLLPVLARLWRRQSPGVPCLTLTFLALGFLALQVRSQRIIEYYPAFAVLLAAWSWSFLGLPALERRLSLPSRWRPWALLLACLLLAAWLGWAVTLARRQASAAPINGQISSYRDGAAWLVANTPPGSLVFNTDWDDFPQLFFYDTHNVYVVGLDPTYLSLYDLELYRLWRAVSSGALANPSSIIRERFGAAYVFTDTLHERFLQVAAADPGLEEVFRSPTAVIYRVREGDR